MSERTRARHHSSLAGYVGGAFARWGAASSWLAVLHHHLTDDITWLPDSPLTTGLSVELPASRFAERLDVLAQHYDVVTLRAARRQPAHGRKHLAITFDDAYASVARVAAPLLAERRLPWTFFVNPGLLDNRTLAFDNLIAYVVNTTGASPVERLSGARVSSIGHFIGTESPRMQPHERTSLKERLVDDLGLDLAAIAADAQLYLTTAELVQLARTGVEIGNHTSDHVHCRALTPEDASAQIGDSAQVLRQITAASVSAFAYPYGSRLDATPTAQSHIRAAGHDSAFLVQGRLNRTSTPTHALYRVSPRRSDALGLAAELEVKPRLRAVKQRVKSGLGAFS